jgi:hypothetical protein
MSVKGPGYAHRLLMLLDEFPTLGRLSFFEGALAFSAGYGIKCFLICQSLNQLEKAYGRDNSIVDNCHVRMAYAANRAETAKTISELMGQSTASKRQRSFSGKGLLGAKSVSESDQEFARPLMTPDEVLRLPYEDALVFVGGLPPYRGRKLMYYLDSRLASRAGLAPPESARAQRRELLPGGGSEWAGLVPAAAPLRPAVLDPLPMPAGGFVPPVPALQPGAAAETASSPPTSLAAAWQELLGEAQPESDEPPEAEAAPAEPSAEPPAPKPPGGLPL